MGDDPAHIDRPLFEQPQRTDEGNGPGPAGDVRAFDIHTGKLAWTFHSIPLPGDPNTGTWAGESARFRTGVNVWGFMTVDVRRGIVYMPFGAPSGDLWGGDRPGNNLYGTSVVAADAKTGKYLWHFQVVHHDIWDFDLESPPVLMDVKQGRDTIPAVAVIGKSSLLYLLNRVTGKPIYGVEERPVAQSHVAIEKTSPTQPFPSKPAPIARVDFTMADIATVTPELEAACRKLIADNNVGVGLGPFAPPSFNHARVGRRRVVRARNSRGSSVSTPAVGPSALPDRYVAQLALPSLARRSGRGMLTHVDYPGNIQPCRSPDPDSPPRDRSRYRPKCAVAWASVRGR